MGISSSPGANPLEDMLPRAQHKTVSNSRHIDQVSRFVVADDDRIQTVGFELLRGGPSGDGFCTQSNACNPRGMKNSTWRGLGRRLTSPMN